ncbi:DUF1045 domain-containing protein [Aestuariicoccus sp. MJ-SS9]|uniref:DUF1045 domain-containing protein n=1 Tax=Aestuariicoccus sp. MJ-SS9 TaxID=3079855 RepID=UPI002909F2DD|nr:DUF1045 domain-containing protein [Aestuariicoccus sp. MJ-SS9]MDU8913957.1 DUF1045 domain-containing protein [Aestuariicoccus sp. MJ-SS9]
MSAHSRYAIYYMPRPGALAAFGAAWLGWDAEAAREVAQPEVEDIAALTEAPGKYGFHATLKPPFRLAEGRDVAQLEAAVAALAARTAPGRADGLTLTRLGRFFALTPVGCAAGLARVAEACVTDLDSFRARPGSAELERRRKPGLTERQEALLRAWGYPYVLDQFRFHMTLSGKVPKARLEPVHEQIARHLPPLPEPFVLEDICLNGEREDGRFELLRRYALSG